MFGFMGKKRRYQAIEPDEILIDAANLPAFDTARLEGKLERPLGEGPFRGFLTLAALVFTAFAGQLVYLQIFQHDALIARAEANRLSHSTIIAERGLILDRNGKALAENAPGDDPHIPMRNYPLGEAAAVVVGYVSYPKQDQNGYWYQEETEGVVGVESLMDERLRGKNGTRIAETNATGDTVSGSIVREAVPGEDIRLSLDADVQKELHDVIAHRSEASGWRGGSGAIMDIETGELVALASYPSFDPGVMSSGEPASEVARLLSDSRSPFLDRAVSGLYTPGSVVKPFMSAAALEEHVITPSKQILSTGSISVPNPYDPAHPSVFKDWKAHGWVDVRKAIAVSSDVYFYEVGGGFEDQPGLGIARIEKYMKMFGFGLPTGTPLLGEEQGIVPDPEWKAAIFDNEPWYLGDTYHTAIGQYGFQVTIMQLLRATAAVANNGELITPVIEAGQKGAREDVDVSKENLQIVREGMRLAVTDGIAQALAVPGVKAAAKTGTAEVGVHKEYVNSLIIGFFPYDKPRYAFAVAMERAKAGTPLGAPAVMGEVLRYIAENKKELVDAR
jgi:penicillin-binding protein 2